MKCIGWSRSVRDTGNRRINSLVKIGGLAECGQVVLLHDSLPPAQESARAEIKALFLKQLEALMENVKQRNLNTETVDSFFSINAYK
jgi:hypothetical protein